MGSVTASNKGLSVRAFAGDFKTLLAFNIAKASTQNLAGFTVQVTPGNNSPYYLWNFLQLKDTSALTDPKQPPNSSINAPFQKLRWLHVPGMFHQGLAPYRGDYIYTVTPRYFDANKHLQPLDASLSVNVKVPVTPFVKGTLSLGFTRGYTQSQAFVHHFGRKALIKPKNSDLTFDTSQVSGTNGSGQTYTFADEYEWLGFTAREQIFAILNEVTNDASLVLDVFAYDLNEFDVVKMLLELGKQGRLRIVLDNAKLHKSTANKAASEDEFEQAFRKVAGGKKAPILRGHFRRYSHDKIFIVRQKGADAPGAAVKVLTGATNFSVTGMYVNSNHVLIYDDPKVAQTYADLFDEVFNDQASETAFLKSPFPTRIYNSPSGNGTPVTHFTFAPHSKALAAEVLNGVAARIKAEESAGKNGSLLFAVMEVDYTKSPSPVWEALATAHKDGTIYSYGISDSPGGINLYKRGKPNGLLVTGKPVNTMLPQPFSQVPQISAGHQIHHKFVVCGFTGNDPVVYCGSSNLASGGEAQNGDNLLEIHDADVATAFAIEAFALVDHFDFLDRYAKGPKAKQKPAPDTIGAAANAHWYLHTDNSWVDSYFDPNDLHYAERNLLA